MNVRQRVPTRPQDRCERWEFTRCRPNDDSLSSRGAVSNEIAQRDV